MKKDEYIRRYGEEAYKRMLEQVRTWQKAHPEETKAFNARYTELRGNDWRVEWEEDEVTKYQAADLFFLGVTPNV